MKCPMCHENMVARQEPYHYEESGLDFIYLQGINIFYCEKCGECVVPIPDVDQLNQLICRRLISRNELLTGQEIRFLRKNIGVKAQKFAKLIGVDRSTLSRWENDDRSANETADKLVRLIYCTIRGIPIEEIQNLIRDRFDEIQASGGKSPEQDMIPVAAWAKEGSCEVSCQK